MPRTPRDQAQRVKRLKRHIYELKSLLEVSRSLAAASDEETILKHFLRSAIFVVQAETAAVFRYEPATGRLRLVEERNLGGGQARPVAVLSADDVQFLEGPAAREGVAFSLAELSPEARAFARERGEWLAAWEAEALVSLAAPAGLWGVAVFGSRLLERGYDALHLGLLSSAAQIAASALDGLAASGRARAAGFAEGAAADAPAEPAAEPAGGPARDEDLAGLRRRFPTLHEIIGDGAALTASLRELSKVAPTRFPVLILGPTGTGKELAARAVHRMSPRAAGPFEVVDCGAIPDELIESELFGHVRGAFTGAARDRRGAFELAHGGTLFLDEIGELPPAAQTKLLRVLQEGQLRRVGDERILHVNVRVVAATNRDLLTEVQRGRFRADLYYRVGVFTVRMPTLAERREDLPLLVRFLVERFAAEAGTPVPRVPQAILRRLSEYSVPGNIRELQNVLTVLLLRSGPEGPRVEDLEELLTQAGEGTAPRGAAGSGAASDGAGADAPARGDLEATGRWVLEQVRKCDFNLAQAERALARLRQSPAGRAAAPVADRSSLTYYLQGECFRAFAEARFDLGAAARAIAQLPDLEPQARVRLARFLDFVAEVAGACADEDEARRECRRRLPKLPAPYLPYLDEVASGFARGEWSAAPGGAGAADRDDEA